MLNKYIYDPYNEIFPKLFENKKSELKKRRIIFSKDYNPYQEFNKGDHRLRMVFLTLFSLDLLVSL